MFTKIVLSKYADVLIWGLETARESTGGKYKKGDVIYIIYELDSLKLTEVLYRKLLEKGMHVIIRMKGTPKMEFDFFDVANEEQLKFLPSWSKEMYKHLNGVMALYAPSSLTHLANIDSKKIAISAIAGKPLRDIEGKREQSGDSGWTLCMMPTKALAKQAKMSVKEYSEEIIKACYLDKKNPVKIWEGIRQKSEAIKKWLNALKIDYLHIESENIDLKITPGEKRKWLGVSGHNIPSFELFTSPDWRGTEGIFYANQPSYRSGNYVTGVRLEFKKGVAVKIDAEKGKSFTRQQLEMDAGAKKLGEFSLTDKRFSKIDKFMADTLFDENFGGKFGNCHVAVGSSYSDTFKGDLSALTAKTKKELGFNDSALHWDLVNTEEKRVSAVLNNGKKILIYEKGMFNY